MKSLSVAFSLALLGLVMTSAMQADDAKAGADAKFLKEAASGGMLEVKLGQLATEQAQNSDVRKFGERMVTDHSKANKELMALAQTNGITLAQKMTKKHQDMVEKLQGMKGAEFDRAYMKHMVKDHEEDVAEFKKQSKTAQSEQVRDFATKTLPTLEEHLRMARSIAAKVGALENP